MFIPNIKTTFSRTFNLDKSSEFPFRKEHFILFNRKLSATLFSCHIFLLVHQNAVYKKDHEICTEGLHSNHVMTSSHESSSYGVETPVNYQRIVYLDYRRLMSTCHIEKDKYYVFFNAAYQNHFILTYV